MAEYERINAQLDIVEAAGLNPGVDWRIVKRFGKPMLEIRTTRAAGQLVRELAKIPAVADAVRERLHDGMLAMADEQPTITELVDRKCQPR